MFCKQINYTRILKLHNYEQFCSASIIVSCKIPVYLNFATQPNAFTLIEKAAASTKVDST